MIDRAQMLHFSDKIRKFFCAEAGEVWKYFCDSAKKVEVKSPTELVGELDKLLEKQLMIFLPGLAGYPVIGEESFATRFGGIWPPAEKSFWLADPIDGTHNFLTGNPNFGSIVALVEDGKVVFGAIYIHSEKRMHVPGKLYFAAKDLGAWKFGAKKALLPLAVSGTEDLKQATLLVEGPSEKVRYSWLAQKARYAALRDYKGLSSSFALTRIANANHMSLPADILIMCGNKPWDSLAGALIVEEADGIVTGFDGTPYSLENCSSLIYSNKVLNEKILALR